MIPLNPDSDKWLVTFCFWTLTYRDIIIGLLYNICPISYLIIICPTIYGIYGLYEGPCPIWHSLTHLGWTEIPLGIPDLPASSEL
jgi:hypothetical protein